MKKSVLYGIFLLCGIALMALSLVLEGRVSDSVGGTMMGIGAGALGYCGSNLMVLRRAQKDPAAMRRAEIETKDERNVAILNRAKAKALDMMFYVFGALMVSLALMGADIGIVLLLVAAYLFVAGCMVYYMCKYQKEM